MAAVERNDPGAPSTTGAVTTLSSTVGAPLTANRQFDLWARRRANGSVAQESYQEHYVSDLLMRGEDVEIVVPPQGRGWISLAESYYTVTVSPAIRSHIDGKLYAPEVLHPETDQSAFIVKGVNDRWEVAKVDGNDDVVSVYQLDMDPAAILATPIAMSEREVAASGDVGLRGRLQRYLALNSPESFLSPVTFPPAQGGVAERTSIHLTSYLQDGTLVEIIVPVAGLVGSGPYNTQELATDALNAAFQLGWAAAVTAAGMEAIVDGSLPDVQPYFIMTSPPRGGRYSRLALVFPKNILYRQIGTQLVWRLDTVMVGQQIAGITDFFQGYFGSEPSATETLFQMQETQPWIQEFEATPGEGQDGVLVIQCVPTDSLVAGGSYHVEPYSFHAITYPTGTPDAALGARVFFSTSPVDEPNFIAGSPAPNDFFVWLYAHNQLPTAFIPRPTTSQGVVAPQQSMNLSAHTGASSWPPNFNEVTSRTTWETGAGHALFMDERIYINSRDVSDEHRNMKDIVAVYREILSHDRKYVTAQEHIAHVSAVHPVFAEIGQPTLVNEGSGKDHAQVASTYEGALIGHNLVEIVGEVNDIVDVAITNLLDQEYVASIELTPGFYTRQGIAAAVAEQVSGELVVQGVSLNDTPSGALITGPYHDDYYDDKPDWYRLAPRKDALMFTWLYTKESTNNQGRAQLSISFINTTPEREARSFYKWMFGRPPAATSSRLTPSWRSTLAGPPVRFATGSANDAPGDADWISIGLEESLVNGGALASLSTQPLIPARSAVALSLHTGYGTATKTTLSVDADVDASGVTTRDELGINAAFDWDPKDLENGWSPMAHPHRSAKTGGFSGVGNTPIEQTFLVRPQAGLFRQGKLLPPDTEIRMVLKKQAHPGRVFHDMLEIGAGSSSEPQAGAVTHDAWEIDWEAIANKTMPFGGRRRNVARVTLFLKRVYPTKTVDLRLQAALREIPASYLYVRSRVHRAILPDTVNSYHEQGILRGRRPSQVLVAVQNSAAVDGQRNDPRRAVMQYSPYHTSGERNALVDVGRPTTEQEIALGGLRRFYGRKIDEASCRWGSKQFPTGQAFSFATRDEAERCYHEGFVASHPFKDDCSLTKSAFLNSYAFVLFNLEDDMADPGMFTSEERLASLDINMRFEPYAVAKEVADAAGGVPQSHTITVIAFLNASMSITAAGNVRVES